MVKSKTSLFEENILCSFRTVLVTSTLTFLAACSGGSDEDSSTENADSEVTQELSVEGADIIAELASKIPSDSEVIRGQRNCELFEVDIQGDFFVLNVWNNGGQGHECSDDWLATVDTSAYKIDGPRWRPIDHMFVVDESLNLISNDNTQESVSGEIREIPEGSGKTMLLAATVQIAPVSTISENAGIFIESMDDVPTELRNTILSQTTSQSGSYSIIEVDRRFDSFWVYLAGEPVYVLSDGNCDYAMKYYTSSVNPAINSEDAVASIGFLLQSLPDGFSYEVRVFEDNIHVLDRDGKQYVINDEFGNSYDTLWCGDALVPYTVL